MTDVLPEVDLDAIVNLADFEPIARERMAGPAYGYVAGGAWDEITLRESVEAWRRFRFVPRVLVDVSDIDVSRIVPRPARLAADRDHADGLPGLAHPEAEAAMRRAAAARGIPFCLSTSSLARRSKPSPRQRRTPSAGSSCTSSAAWTTAAGSSSGPRPPATGRSS